MGQILQERGKNRRNKDYHQIPNIRIILGSKFHLPGTILTFWTKFVYKRYNIGAKQKKPTSLANSAY